VSSVPIIVFVIFFVLPASLFGLLLAKIIKKSKADSWTGEVVDKKHNSRRDFDNPKKIEHFYSVIFKTDDGREKKMGLSRELYDTWQVGDRGKKEKGKLFPEKI
jgi:hypothetical protein